MSLSQLSQQQLLELVNQLLAQVQLVLPTSGSGTPGAGVPAIRDATTAEPSVIIEELPAGEPVVPIVIQSILRRPKTELGVATPVVSQSSEDTETSPASQVREPVKPEGWKSWASEESLVHDTPQVEKPAEYNESRKVSGHSPMSEAWKELEANLVASRELTNFAREKEATVMKEWGNFHDYAGARKYSGKWYNLVQGHKEEFATAAKFRQQRAERAREARESREALERARRLREAKEKEAARIQAELERARAEEMAALSMGRPTPGPAKPPAKEERPSRQKSC